MAEVSVNQTDTVVLSASDPTLVVDSGVSILSTTDNAVYADQTAVWTVTNKGRITSGGSPGTDGVYLQGPGSIVTNDGSISGSGGVFLGAGGTVTNALNASISASGSPATDGAPAVSGIDVEYGFGTVSNYGTIGSNSYGVALEAGGAVTNYASGSITGATDAVYSVRASATVDNFGQLTATVGDGVGFYNGGTLINEIGAVTTGSGSGSSAVKFNQYAGALKNDGTMRGGEVGAYFQAGGSVVNGAKNASALLQGGSFGVYLSNLPGSTSLESVTNDGVITATAAASYGVYIDGNAGTVTNAGVITGSASSVYFAVTSAANRLIVDPGAIFNGLVYGGGGTLELAGTSSSTFSASIAPSGGFESFSALQVDAGATWKLSSSDSIPTVLLNGALEVASSLTATSIVFGLGGKLTVDNASTFGSPLLEYFAAGDVIDIHGIAAVGATISYNSTTGIATIVNGAQTTKLTFQPSTLGVGGTLQLVSDGGTGLDVVLTSSTPPTPPPPVTPPPPGSGATLEISTSQTSVVTLSAPHTTLLVDSGVSITSATDDGVYGNETAVWTVSNKGTITSNGAVGTDGILLQGPSSIVTNTGSVFGSGGVYLGAGGTVTNALNASIHSSGLPTAGSIAPVSGVNIEYGTGTVKNSGTITSEGYGVGLEDGGSVINYASGSITGAEDAIFIERSYGTVDNYGQLTATYDDGVGFFNGGTLINEIGGQVTCLDTTTGTGPSAVFFSRYSGALQNDGTMHGTKAAAYFDMGGAVINGASNASALLQGDSFGVYMSNAPGSTTAETVTNYGVISGGTASGSCGVYVIGNGGTVTNAGTITGGSYSVDFAVTSAANRLIVDPGAIFNGLTVGGGGTLELAGTSAGTFSPIIGPTGDFEGFSAVQVDAGAIWMLSQDDSIPTVLLNGSLEVAWSLAATSIVFGAGGKLIVDNVAPFTSPLLENFVAGDLVDIHGIAAAAATISYNSTTGVATIVSGAQTAKLDFQASTLGAGTLQLVSDGGIGLDVVLASSTPPAPPAPVVTAPAGSSTVATYKPTISGTGVAGDIVSLSIDGSAAVTTTVASNGTWSYTPLIALTNASHTITATQAATGGPSSAAATDTFTVSVPPPSPTITAPASGSIDATTTQPVISGGGVSGDTVTVKIDGVQVGTALVANSLWTFTPTTPLTNASHTITATQAATGGPSSTAAADTFMVNVPPPAPTITTPANGSTNATVDPLISGGGVTGDTVTVNIDGVDVGTALVVNSAWSFTPATALANSSHTITATQAATGGPSSAAAADTFMVNVSYPPAAQAVHANDISLSGGVTGPYNFIDRLNLQASYADLINAFGTNEPAMQNWFNAREAVEQRPDSFDGLDYIASYGDLINAFKGAGSIQAVLDAGAEHYITNGHNEGRTTTFNGLDYIASYADLIKAFGVDGDAGAYHYIEHGVSEGRTTTFDGLDYIASYTDLIKAFGANEQAGAAHYISYGYNEGRATTFDGLDYIAGYTDLMKAFGANNDAGATHYIDYGLNEGRSAAPFNVAAYESAHPDLNGKYASDDAFLTAYINTYATSGKFLT